ncbi:MAG: hypothetical protein FD174_4267 [Geobacteraceae bacterium]|nr:MAG: hypothetical protein FD174_4267 [Geobacteraceae bacterium]
MKKIFLTIALLCLVAVNGHAGLKVLGNGNSMRFDPSGFPSSMRTNYEIMKVKCVRCHTLERTVVAITTGISPITGQPFDRNAIRAYGIKMMRKPDSNMTKQEVKATVDLMNYMLDESTR